MNACNNFKAATPGVHDVCINCGFRKGQHFGMTLSEFVKCMKEVVESKEKKEIEK